MSKVFRVWYKWTTYRNVNAHCLHVNASNKGEAELLALDYLVSLSELPQNKHLGKPIIGRIEFYCKTSDIDESFIDYRG